MKTWEAHLLNPVQRADLLHILPRVPNERRLAVIAAYVGSSPSALCRAAGLPARTRCYYRTERQTSGASAMGWCWRIAQRLGLVFTDLWEVDEAFDPIAALGLSPKETVHEAPPPTRARAALSVVRRVA